MSNLKNMEKIQKGLKFECVDGRFVIPEGILICKDGGLTPASWLDERYPRSATDPSRKYFISLKTLGFYMHMRSDKLYRLMQQFNTHRIVYQNSWRDDGFYIASGEDAAACENWIHDTILKVWMEATLLENN